MSRDINRKTIYVVMILLLVVVICEGLILFLVKDNNNTKKQVATSSNTPEYTVVPAKNPAMNILLLDTLKTLKKDAVVSSLLTIVYEGTVVSVRMPSESDPNQTRVQIQIRGKEEVTNLYFNKNEMQKVSIVNNIQMNGDKNAIRFEDLKVGRRIRVEEVVNVMEDWSTATRFAKIVILSQ